LKVTYVNPSFLDYRVPVYAALDQLLGGKLTVIYSKRRTPERVVHKIEAVLGNRAVGLTGERILTVGKNNSDFANSGIAIPYQPDLLKTVLSIESDVVVAEGFFQWTPAAVTKKVLQGTPLVLSYEKTAHTERNCPWWRTAFRRRCLRFIDAVVCNGKLSKDYIESLGMSVERIVTGGMAADSNGLRTRIAGVTETQIRFIRTQFGLTRPVFLYVGRMIKCKGVAELLRGWGIYKKQKFSPGSLLLVGGGNQENALRQMVKDKNLPDVHFTGEVDYDDIAQFYAVADVFVMPTLEDNWSLAIPEAMACGLPIACSKFNGCWPELAKEGENGKVFDPKNPNEMAEILFFFARNLSRLPQMGSRSQEIEKDFAPTNAARAILKAINIAVSGKRKGGFVEDYSPSAVQ
jgi:glycosyltransferase involved in cell wall biosynthesis